MTLFHVNVDSIQATLFETPKVLERITRDYSFATTPTSPNELGEMLLAALGQTPAVDPLKETPSNRQVFKAAVKALASNSRSWATFLKNESRLVGLLGGYDPQATAQRADRGELGVAEIAECVPGQSGTADARAMLKWAKSLAEGEVYSEGLTSLGMAFLDARVERDELTACVAAFIARPPARAPQQSGLRKVWQKKPTDDWKARGMGPPLASEFLRNLGWDGFKPDRHVVRLFSQWFPEMVEECEPRASELACLIGTGDKQIIQFFQYSLVGAKVIPPGYSLSQVDNFVWALGEYVEKKGKETGRVYVL